MDRKAFIPVAVAFVLGGTLSTVSSKWSDQLKSVGRHPIYHNNTAQPTAFSHPYAQTWFMFLGEVTCALIFLLLNMWKRRQGIAIIPGRDTALPMNRLLYAIPALCDFTASTTMFIGLTLTDASVYQMLRGATVLFTGVFSVMFLKRVFKPFNWFGISLVIVGLALVGLSSILYNKADSDDKNPILGNILIFAAQIVVSIQMVIEEKLLTKYGIHPFQLVGWEGLFGLIYMSTTLAIFQAVNPMPDDFIDCAYQLVNNWQCWFSYLLCFFAIIVLNATGQALTKYLSATTRMVLDTLRNVIIWIICLTVPTFGETFEWMQLAGFLSLVAGTCIYKNVLVLPIKWCYGDGEGSAEGANPEASPLISDSPSPTISKAEASLQTIASTS